MEDVSRISFIRLATTSSLLTSADVINVVLDICLVQLLYNIDLDIRTHMFYL